jgi:hypothetical protein
MEKGMIENNFPINGSGGNENGRVGSKRLSNSSTQHDRENELQLEIRARDEQIAMMVEEHRMALAKMGENNAGCSSCAF